jgi:hypothetical protein
MTDGLGAGLQTTDFVRSTGLGMLDLSVGLGCITAAMVARTMSGLWVLGSLPSAL